MLGLLATGTLVFLFFFLSVCVLCLFTLSYEYLCSVLPSFRVGVAYAMWVFYGPILVPVNFEHVCVSLCSAFYDVYICPRCSGDPAECEDDPVEPLDVSLGDFMEVDADEPDRGDGWIPGVEGAEVHWALHESVCLADSSGRFVPSRSLR